MEMRRSSDKTAQSYALFQHLMVKLCLSVLKIIVSIFSATIIQSFISAKKENMIFSVQSSTAKNLIQHEEALKLFREHILAPIWKVNWPRLQSKW
jgi:hypothetical protein